jgi:hypothetical protein
VEEEARMKIKSNARAGPNTSTGGGGDYDTLQAV